MNRALARRAPPRPGLEQRLRGNDWPVIGITGQKLDGVERYVLCVPRDHIGPYLTRGGLEELGALIPKILEKMDEAPDDGPARVVRQVRAG